MSSAKRGILQMNAFEHNISSGGLLGRRMANAGASSVLFYKEPIEMVSASGTWMHAVDGTHYLDFYNNVPSVGHCHPNVVDAITQQLRKLNINTRYLNEPLERYIERLKATLPNREWNIALTCSGSEANDLAMRVAEKVTGNSGYIVSENAYHGNTRSVTEISPASFLRGKPPENVIAVPAPSKANFADHIASGFTDEVVCAIHALKKRGYGVAALICDSIFSSDGVFADPSGFIANAVAVVHDSGGLYIADEVQPGFARTGSGFWGFEHHGVSPDMVTMGKPMGNGYPMAAIAARPDHMSAYCSDIGYFNTFGGSPVSAMAGLAVLDVIEGESLQTNARIVGNHLRARLDTLTQRYQTIGEVRHQGLFMGIELVDSEQPEKPDAALASRTIEGLRIRRVLIGAAGRYGNILKVRPPLCLTIKEADFFVDALDTQLATAN